MWPARFSWADKLQQVQKPLIRVGPVSQVLLGPRSSRAWPRTAQGQPTFLLFLEFRISCAK